MTAEIAHLDGPTFHRIGAEAGRMTLTRAFHVNCGCDNALLDLALTHNCDTGVDLLL